MIESGLWLRLSRVRAPSVTQGFCCDCGHAAAWRCAPIVPSCAGGAS